MATYIQGVTDYIPQVQPWAPNFNFYQSVLERKQNQYDRGWEQVNSVYNSILNAPMLRNSNIERRDQFFKDVESQIKQISNVDLSLAQNVDAATQIFRPFYEDQDIVHDIGFTKKYQDELRRADALRDCSTKDCEDKYWEGGVRAMHYKAQEFANATDADALKMSAPRYTDNFNMMKEGTKAVKELGLDMKQDKITGRWIVTTQGGEQAIGPLEEFLQLQFGEDDRFTSYNRTKAYLLRHENPDYFMNIYDKSLIERNAQTPEEAQALLEDKVKENALNTAKATVNKSKDQALASLDELLVRKNLLENKMRTEGILEGSKEDKMYQEILNNQKNKENLSQKLNELSTSINGVDYIDANGNKISTDKLDAIVAQAIGISSIKQTARVLAYKDYKVDIKTNPYGLAAYNNQLAMNRDAVNRMYSQADAAVKRIRERGDTWRKKLIEDNYIDVYTGLPYDNNGNAIKGGGMGIGDDADKAAYVDELLTEGYSSIEALQMMEQKFGKTARPDEGASYLPIYQKPITGLGATSTENVKMDDRVQRSAEDVENGKEGAHKDLVDNTTDMVLRFAQYAENQKNTAEHFKAQFVTRRLGPVLEKASTGLSDYIASPDYLKSRNMAIFLGDLIAEQEKAGSPYIKELKKVPEGETMSPWDKYFKDFPNTNNRNNYNPDVIKNIMNNGLIDVVIRAAGKDKIYNVMTGVNVPVTVRDPKSPDLIDHKALGIMSVEEYQQTEAIPLDKRTPEQTAALNKYISIMDGVQTKMAMEDYGLGSTLNDIEELTPEEFLQLSEVNAALYNSNKIKKDFRDKMKGNASSFVAKYSNDDTPILDLKLSALIWDPTATGGYGTLMSLPNIMNRIVADKTIADNTALDTSFGTPNPYKSTVLELESKYMGDHGQFNGEGLKQMLSTSEILFDFPAPQDLDLQGLLKTHPTANKQNDNPLLNELLYLGSQLTGEDAGIWGNLLSHPKTKVDRKGNTAIVSSPYMKTPKSFNLTDIEVMSTYDRILSDASKKVPKMQAEFMKNADASGSAQAIADLDDRFSGDFGLSSPDYVNITVSPSKKTSALRQFKEFAEEAQSKFETDLSNYGLVETQGSKQLLDAVVNIVNTSYKNPKDAPVINFSFNPVYGNRHVTKIEFELIDSPATKKYLTEAGLYVTGIKGTVPSGQYAGSEMKVGAPIIPTKGTYYIPNSQNSLLQNMPSARRNIFYKIKDGGTYVDDSYKDALGTVITYKGTGNGIDTYISYNQYNFDTKEYEPVTVKSDAKITFDQDIDYVVNNINTAVLQSYYARQAEIQRRSNEEGVIKSPEHYKKQTNGQQQQ